MYFVIKHDHSIGRDVVIMADGTINTDRNQAELFRTNQEAVDVAAKFGGQVVVERQIFGDDK